MLALLPGAALLVKLSVAQAGRERRADDASVGALATLVQRQGTVLQGLQAQLSATDVRASALATSVSALTAELNSVKSKVESTSKAGTVSLIVFIVIIIIILLLLFS